MLRIAEWERLEQHGAHDGENCRVGADAEGEAKDRQG
jgi:hypothetical protein